MNTCIRPDCVNYVRNPSMVLCKEHYEEQVFNLPSKEPIVITGTKTIYVDVDDTLVIWEGEDYYGHPAHIEMIKKFYKRGHTLIAWSAGGAEWAAAAIEDLHLDEYFRAILSKPDWYLDDKLASEFMPEANRIYLPFKKS